MAEDDEWPGRFRAIDDAVHLLELHTRLRRIFQSFNFDAWAVGCLRDGDRPASMFLQHWPVDWIKEYIAAGYAAYDPAVARAMASPNSFTWDDLRAAPLSAKARRIMDSATSGFGWRAGLVVPIHGPADERGIVSLASTEPAAPDRPRIEALARAAYRRGRALDLEGANGPALTPREREALGLVARGADDADIALALGISKATAHAHVERAKRRLGARTRAHAVAIAIKQRLLEQQQGPELA